MSSRTPNQEKALAWYCKEKQLKPELSTHPTYFFTSKITGNRVTNNILNIVSEWNRMRKEEAKK